MLLLNIFKLFLFFFLRLVRQELKNLFIFLSFSRISAAALALLLITLLYLNYKRNNLLHVA